MIYLWDCSLLQLLLPTLNAAAGSADKWVLQNAGGKGWSQVYKVRSYHVPLDDRSLGIMADLLKKYTPEHCPIWTVLGVPALGIKEMRVEIDVTAHLG